MAYAVRPISRNPNAVAKQRTTATSLTNRRSASGPRRAGVVVGAQKEQRSREAHAAENHTADDGVANATSRATMSGPTMKMISISTDSAEYTVESNASSPSAWRVGPPADRDRRKRRAGGRSSREGKPGEVEARRGCQGPQGRLRSNRQRRRRARTSRSTSAPAARSRGPVTPIGIRPSKEAANICRVDETERSALYRSSETNGLCCNAAIRLFHVELGTTSSFT
jgi:hypothetical protein